MQRLKPFQYQVAAGEHITVTVTSIGFNPPLVVASGSGCELTRSETRSQVDFAFDVSLTRGEFARVRIALDFPPAPLSGSHYHIHASGREVSGYDLPDYYPMDGRSFTIRFERV